MASEAMNYRKQPLHGDVVKVRKLQQRILFSFIGNSSGEVEVEKALSDAFKSSPDALADFQTDMDEFEYAATVILSTGLDSALIDAMEESEFLKVYEASKAALGGTASDFLGRYMKGIPSAKAVKKRGLKTSNRSAAKSSSGA